MARPKFDQRIADRILFALQHLQPEGMTVTDMVKRAKINKRTAMKYLKILEREGIVVRFKIGNYTIYRLK